MKTVERHPIDTAEAAERTAGLAASFERNTPKVTRSPARLRSLRDIALMRLGIHCTVDPSAEKLDTWVSFTHATQTATAMISAGTAEAGAVDCTIDQRNLSIPATGPGFHIGPDDWETALWLSVICRDHDRVRSLAAVDTRILRNGPSSFDDYLYSWIAALQVYFRGDASEALGELQSTARLLSPDIATKTDPGLLDDVARTRVLLFLHLATRNEAGFNEALRESLEAHRDFWTEDRKARTNPVGYIALAPLAFACVAHDHGFTLDVESDYLPTHLIEGSWISEFPF